MTTTYRPDIDGLRAIAVLLVLFFHAGFAPVSGGFIGVDVFFVISGYLITSIVYRDITEGVFTFRRFYLRRIRRLFPAFFGLIAVTTVVAATQLLPVDLVAYMRSLIASTLSFANVFFWRSEAPYFAPTTDEMPLLHTWSLAVEEQFYLLWPLFLLLTHRALGRRRVWLLAALIGGLSVWVSEWAATAHPRAAFYLLPTRAFELMIGALLALAWDRLPAVPRAGGRILAMVALGVVLASGAVLNEASRVPGLNVLWPALGTAVLIYTGRDEDGPVTRFLSWKPMVGIGLISYSLYLWHWPIVAFTHYRLVEWTASTRWLVVVTSIALGALSWRFVEQPFRFRVRYGFRRTVLQLLAVPAAVTVAVAMVTISQRGFVSRLDGNEVYQALLSRNRFATHATDWCHYQVGGLALAQEKVRTCRLGVPEDRAVTTAVLYGDSHAGHYSPFVDALAEPAGVSVTDLSGGGCPPVLEPGRWGNNPDVCRFLADTFRTRIESYDVAIIAARWESVISEGRLPAVIDAITYASRHVRDVVVLAQIPLFRQNLSACALRENFLRHGGTRCYTGRAIETNDAYAAANDTVRERIAHLDNVRFLRTDTLICNGTCNPYIDDVLIYYDESHLNVAGARKLASVVDGALFPGLASQ